MKQSKTLNVEKEASLTDEKAKTSGILGGLIVKKKVESGIRAGFTNMLLGKTTTINSKPTTGLNEDASKSPIISRDTSPMSTPMNSKPKIALPKIGQARIDSIDDVTKEVKIRP